MSSETINVIDHLTKNLNNHKATIKDVGSKSCENGTKKSDSGKANDKASTNKKHFEPAKIIESNKRFKNGTQNELNKEEEKGKGANKQLSFFHSDDEGDADSRSNTPERLSVNKGDVEEEIILIHEDGDDDDSGSKDLDVKINETTTTSNQDDASSTSSCSCEDHSSNASPALDPHVDLDYDEDSIIGSPNEVSNGNSNKKAQSCSTSGNSTTSPSLQDSTKNTLTTTSDNNSDTRKATNHQALSEGENVDTDDDDDDDDGDDDGDDDDDEKPSQRHNTRIKSFINLDHIHYKSEQDFLKKDEGKKSDRSTKSYNSLLRYFFKDTCYFQIKSINHENVELSKSMGVWSTPIQNEIRLNAAFREHRNVILIFSVQQSGAFQGFARMISEARPSNRPIPWILPERLSNRSLGGVMELQWLCTKELQFQETLHLFNPYNDNKPVKIARDGQQVEPRVGKKLCKLFPEDDKNRLIDSITTLKHQISLRKKTTIRYDNYYPFAERGGFVPPPYNGRHRHDFPPHNHQLQHHLPTSQFMGPNEFIMASEPPYPMDGYMDPKFDVLPANLPRFGGAGRDRTFNHSNHQPGIYHRQNFLGSNNFSGQSSRHQHPMQAQRRNLPARYMMPYSESNSHPNSGGVPDQEHHQSNSPVMWSHSSSPMRNHPYQRFRR